MPDKPTDEKKVIEDTYWDRIKQGFSSAAESKDIIKKKHGEEFELDKNLTPMQRKLKMKKVFTK